VVDDGGRTGPSSIVHHPSAFYLLALVVLVVDQWTKHLAVQALADGRVIPLIPGYLVLNLVHNEGSAFGLFQGGAAALAIVSVVAVGVIVWIERRGLPGIALRVAVALQLGGAVGNFIDRARLRYVIDFIEIDWRGRNIWPVFNIADSAITVGTILLVIWLWRSESPTPKPESPPASEA
jgi:signal peptidase II